MHISYCLLQVVKVKVNYNCNIAGALLCNFKASLFSQFHATETFSLILPSLSANDNSTVTEMSYSSQTYCCSQDYVSSYPGLIFYPPNFPCIYQRRHFPGKCCYSSKPICIGSGNHQKNNLTARNR